MYEVVFSKKAEYDIDLIEEFIGNNLYSYKVISSIYSIIDLLKINPEMGVEIVEGEREIVEPKHKYQIRYAIVGNEINILLIYKFNNIRGR